MKIVGQAISIVSLSLVTGCGVLYVPQAMPVNITEQPQNSSTPIVKIDAIDLTPSTAAAANTDPFPRLVIDGADKGGAGRVMSERAALGEVLPPKGLPQPYRLGVGDVLSFARLMPHPVQGGAIDMQLNVRKLPITSDGYVSILEVGRVEVSGLTVADAEKAISAALLRAGQDPRFELAVTGFYSKVIAVSGDLGSNASTTSAGTAIPYTDRPITLAEVLTKAGLQLKAGQDKVVRLLRGGKEYRISARRLVTTAAGQDYYARGNDTIFVQSLTYRPENVVVAGEVGLPSIYPISQEERQTLLDALYASGGPSPVTADTSQIYLIRRIGKGVQAFHLNAKDPSSLTIAGQLELRPNDVVFVAAQPITNFNRVLQQFIGTSAGVSAVGNGVRSVAK